MQNFNGKRREKRREEIKPRRTLEDKIAYVKEVA
jgi:hypothetical protein